MKRQTLLVWCGFLSLALATAVAHYTFAQETITPRPEGRTGYRLSGPHTYKNLTVFLIHGEDKLKGRSFLTLQEAMERRVVVVHETRNVNELSIENLSPREEVYVQSGDIVKGGQQDRMLSTDLIVPARSGRVPVAAFCVERGRWRQRGGEAVARFSGSNEMVATKDLKVAAKHAKSQGAVWGKVDEAQAKLRRNVGAEVAARESASSLQLTLENRRVQATAAEYVRQLSALAASEPDVIGYVFAVNGAISSADLYASRALFLKLWPKLLKATAVEAVAEWREGERARPVAAAEVNAFLETAEAGRASEQEITSRVRLITRESDRHLFFETRDAARHGTWVHRNYLAK